MKRNRKIYLGLAAAVVALGLTSDSNFQFTASAQDSQSGFTRFMSKVSDSLASAFGESEQVAIKALREQRTTYPDILGEETTQKIENALIQGDATTKKTLALRIAKDFKKPTQEGLKSFVTWFENWEEEGNIKLAKFTQTLPSIPAEDEFLTKAAQGNRYSQVVMLWIYRAGGQYAKAVEMEATLAGAAETATELKSNYAEDQKLVKAKAKDTESAFWQAVCGDMEVRGLGATQDLSDALSWYRKAALQGFGQAGLQFARAVNSSSAAKDSQRFEALLWLKKLALINDSPIADMGSGLMYMNGKGVARDHAMAAVLLNDAAQAGVPQAMFALGKIYENGGVGVNKDAAKAAAWYAVAQKHGYDAKSELQAKDEDVSALEKTITGTLSDDDKMLAEAVFKDIYNR